nr:hypothetical protein [uncultured Carboxylicivirga sp.]
MKNNIIYSFILMMFVFASCDDDEQVVNFLPSSTVTVDVDKVTVFDTSFPVNFTSTSDDVNELIISGGEIEGRSVAISNHVGATTFTADDFTSTNWVPGESESFTSLINFENSQSTTVFNISVAEALSLEASKATVSEYDSTRSYLGFLANSFFQNIGNITVELGVKNAAQPVPVFDVIAEGANVMDYSYNDSVIGADYSLGDTVVVKITGVSGKYTESKEVEIPVISKVLASESVATLTSSSNKFAFLPAEEGGVDAGVINLYNIKGFNSSDVMFVKIEEGEQVESFDDLDQFSTLVSVVDKANLTSQVESVKKGEVYAFKYTYMYWDYYGYMNIDDVFLTDAGDAENGFSFIYKQDKKD